MNTTLITVIPLTISATALIISLCNYLMIIKLKKNGNGKYRAVDHVKSEVPESVKKTIDDIRENGS